MKKTKPETDSLLRVPKAKNKLGLKINPIAMPHDDLIKPEHPRLELVEDNANSLTSQTTHAEIAPTKNFQKVPNSITKDAIPDGLFKQGKSKHLYDVLYSITRGAIEPKRMVRLSKTKLRKLAGIGSRVTFDSCVSHLESVGLLKIIVHIGEHEGNEFEVFLPEEISLTSHTRQTSLSSVTRYAQKLDRLVCLETSQTRQSLIVDSKVTYASPNTSLKTNTKNDDEPYGALIEILRKIGHGKREDWQGLGELLKMEFDIAASRTKQVTNAPAFLTEHLRRRLMPVRKEATKSHKSSSREKRGTVKSIEAYEAEPLTEQGRELTLKAFAGYMEKGQKEFLMGLQDSYTTKDWDWLLKELKIS